MKNKKKNYQSFSGPKKKNGAYVFVLLFVSLIHFTTKAQEVDIPKAKKIPNRLIIHGDTLIDNYFWMRDKESSEVINHLYSENNYASEMMKKSAFLQKALYEEFKSKTRENFTSRPRKNKNYIYFSEYAANDEYPRLYRQYDSANSRKQVVLDIPKLAKDFMYVSLTGMNYSSNQKWLYYGLDTKGNRVGTYYLKNIEEDSIYANDKLENVMSLIWANDNKTVFYTKPENKTLRQNKIYRHTLGTPTESDVMVLEETDSTFELAMQLSSSEEYLFFLSANSESTETYYLKTDNPANKPVLFLPKSKQHKYSLDHTEGDYFYVTSDHNAINGKLCKTKISKPDIGSWKDVIPHRENVLLGTVIHTKDYIIYLEKENAEEKIIIRNKTTNESKEIKNPFSFGSMRVQTEDYNYNRSTKIQFTCENMVNPYEVWEYNLLNDEQERLEVDSIPGKFNPDLYESKRIYATASDGKKIPITLAFKKGTTISSTTPLILNGYGAYGMPSEPEFSILNCSYLDRGFIYAVAHIRGGNDLGMQWYEEGKMNFKMNTFTDFISCAEHLIENKYTCKEKLAITGGSAGGLLMGAVVNIRPDLFNCVVANVPFVDVINTMLDETLPLTTFEFKEWGNPKIENEYRYIRTYSPYENVSEKKYPNMLVTSGYNDSQVGYWEPAKWVAKIREVKKDSNLLLFKTNMEAGHGGASGRYSGLKEQAFQMAFIMKCLGVKEDYIHVRGVVVDENNSNIPFVNVFVEGTTNGVTANADGEFVVTMKQNEESILVFQSIGFKTRKEKIDVNSEVSQLIIKLKSENYQLQEVVIKAKSKDPAYAIMKEAIKRRKNNLEKVESFTADIYMKTNVKLLEIPKKIPAILDKKNFPDSTDLGIVYLSESVAKFYFQRPDKKKEQMIASKVAGTKTGFSWNRVEDVFVNFYEPSIDLWFYSERPFISPVAPGALLSYKFKYLGTIYDEAKPIHKIQVTPRRKGDPLFTGTIYVSEENYQLYSCDLFVTKDAQIDFADTVGIKQEMALINDSIFIPIQLKVQSLFKIFGFKARDIAVASMSNYQVNTAFTKKFFTNEIFKIEETANKKDSSFWLSTRPNILTGEEAKHYNKGDSILKKQDTKEYKDSVDRVSRKLSIGLNGITKNNPRKGTYFTSNSIFDWVNYNTVEGTRFQLLGFWSQRNKDTWERKNLSFFMRYGLDNRRLSGGVRGFMHLDLKKRQSISGRVGRYVKQFNNNDPIGELINTGYTLFEKQNFIKLYQKDQIEISYEQEIIPGLFTSVDLNYSRREALNNTSYYYWNGPGKRHFTTNNPAYENIYLPKINPYFNDTSSFSTHQAVQIQVGLKFLPFAKYETYPNFKVIKTKWPELSMVYRKSIATQNISFNYDFLQMGIGKDIDLKSVGKISFDAFAGIFFNTNGMQFIDYKHFSGNQTIFLLNKDNKEIPGYSNRQEITEFHNLPYYTYSTNDRYAEVHLSHNFRGFFISKIPILRKTKFYEIVGFNGMFTPTARYTEAFVGVDKIFKFFRLDIGSSLQDQKISPFYRFGFRLGF